MNKMIHTAGNFQYSVNIAYDLHNADKLRLFIPTVSSMELLEKIILSTEKTSTDRARILIGAYGKGKSHIVLTILSVLMRHEPKSDFVHLNKKLEEFPKIKQLVENYYESGKRLLPVLITGSGSSLAQSFLVALKNALSENGLSDFMPETNYKAAVSAIRKWQGEYPDVIRKFESVSETKAGDFISALEDFNVYFYRRFEKIYPSLTAGSVFNPFLGFDVAELYESVAKELKRQKLYDGLYVVYDEFSKYLESNIESASVSDTKMLQDFAEKSCRSGENQLHLLLISHKEISNYIDKLPKQKTDGWRGISERFAHVILNNNFSQVYEIISTVIQKDEALWKSYRKNHAAQFESVCQNYKNHELFSEFTDDGGIEKLFDETFPLHPVSTFILPRLSERIAQNERTLFTFLSARGDSTLPSFLSGFGESDFSLVTPDLIFDYFEPLFKKEVYSPELHEIYHLTSVILEKLSVASEKNGNAGTELERKIVKSISLIYILSQFEKLKPVHEEIVRIYSYSYPKEKIENALSALIEKEFVIYQRQSNSYLKLKETSGVDIALTVSDEVERQSHTFSLSRVLNACNEERYLYPYRYNDEKEMTRYFEFHFVEFTDFENSPEFKQDSADGIVFGILCKSEDECSKARKKAAEFSESKNAVFVVPKTFSNIEKAARNLGALDELKKRASGDEVLFSEYQVVFEDVREIVVSFIRNYTHPEKHSSVFIYGGKIRQIGRKSELTALLSDICQNLYSHSPIINSEAINKNSITAMAASSRRKILAGLLRNPLEKNLGLTGTGQDVAIMRSTLVHTGLLCQGENSETAEIVDFDILKKEDKFVLAPIISEIESFAEKCSGEKVNFGILYENLCSSKNGIGARRGIIPIFLALVFGKIKNQLVLYSNEKQIPLNADSLSLVNENPGEFYLLRFALDGEKKSYLDNLKRIFSVKENPQSAKSDAERIFDSMNNWYLSLPKYSRESESDYSPFLRILKENPGVQETLFSKIPSAFGKNSCDMELASLVGKAKSAYDKKIDDLKDELRIWLFGTFGGKRNEKFDDKYSVSEILKSWLENRNPKILNHLFTDGTERFVSLIHKCSSENSISIEEIALVSTDLRISDWSDVTKAVFEKRLSEWKTTAENFDSENSLAQSQKRKIGNPAAESDSAFYSVGFMNDDGVRVTKNFGKVSVSPHARLLRNKITDSLSAMGRSMSDAEKRQVLMEILKELC